MQMVLGFLKTYYMIYQVFLLGIIPKNAETLIWKDTYNSMFIAALFTIIKI